MYIIYLSSENNQTEANKHLLSTLKAQDVQLLDGTYPETTDRVLLQKYEAQVVKEIKKCDAVVIEASKSTFDLGRFMTLGMQQFKPVLLLQQNEANAAPVLLTSQRLSTLHRYTLTDKKKLEEGLVSFLEDVKKQKLHYRFNLMLNDDINDYLLEKAGAKGISKADYIRNLILDDMDA
ncbi:MAG: hypothetical protein ACEQSA_04570 [Weeksellaceae bacterium]